MSWERGCDEKLGIENTHVAFDYVGGRHRIQMVNRDSLMNIVTLNTEVATVVSNDDMIADVTPLLGHVELLVDVTIEPEGRLSNRTTKS
jgi:hypothetical protein